MQGQEHTSELKYLVCKALKTTSVRNRLLKDEISFYFVPVLSSLFSPPSQNGYFPVSCERL